MRNLSIETIKAILSVGQDYDMQCGTFYVYLS